MRGIDLTWQGGEHTFALNIDLLRALQQRCDAGPPFILTRLRTNSWFVDDVIEPIRLGLEGGGLSKEDARKLTRQFVEDNLTESVLTAIAVLMHTLYGDAKDEDDEPGEAEAAAETK